MQEIDVEAKKLRVEGGKTHKIIIKLQVKVVRKPHVEEGKMYVEVEKSCNIMKNS